jgi:lipopolysaccharide export system protein LptA
MRTLLPLLFAAMLATTGSVRAEKADREKDVNVVADKLTADDQNSISTFEGTVVITQGTMRVTAAKVVVTEDIEGFKRYVASGAPVTFRQKRDKVDEFVEGNAERAEFDDRTEIVKLFNRARMKSNQGEVNGDFISYDRSKEYFQVLGAAPGAAAAPNARVKATLIPSAKKGADGKGAESKDAKPEPPITLKSDTLPAPGSP